MSAIDDETIDLTTSIEHELAGSNVSLLLYSRDGVRALPLVVGRRLVVGRGLPADAPLRDASISRQHAAFELSGGVVWVEDLGSTNGTKVRGERVTRCQVQAGEEIVLGSVRASLHAAEPLEGPLGGLSSHDQLQTLLENEVARASYFGRKASLVMVTVEGPRRGDPDRWLGWVQQQLRPVDRAALYEPHTVEILLPEPAEAPPLSLAQAITGEGDEGEARLLCGVATFPDSATSAEQMISVCREALARADHAAPVQCAPALGAAPLAAPAPPGAWVVASPAMESLQRLVTRLAAIDISLLIQGETGVGKELVASALHEQSTRAAGPLCSINCAAIPTQLVESVLFGHERGAFTGAIARAAGVFEQAHGGTVYLDEIGELTAAAQAALLRVLETKRVRRVGASEEIEVDVRVVSSTHRDLEQMCDAGGFRWDLLYRLNAMVIRVPPLRERPEEIAPLTQAFVAEHGAERQLSIDPEAMELLSRYRWPGNIRELRNTIARAVAVCQGEVITADDLSERVQTLGMSGAVLGELRPARQLQTEQRAEGEPRSFRERVEQFEIALLLDALAKAGWNQAKAARLLGLSPRALYHRCRVAGLRKGSERTAELSRELAPMLGVAFADGAGKRVPFKEQLQRYEQDLLVEALQLTGFNKAEAARQLRMPLRTLVYKVSHYGITEDLP